MLKNLNRLWRAGLIAALGLLTAVAMIATRTAAAPKGGTTTPPPPGTIMFDMTVNGGTADWKVEQWGMKADGTGRTNAIWHRFCANSSYAMPSARVYGTDAIRDRIWLTHSDIEVTINDVTKTVRELFACRLGADGVLQTTQLTALYPHVAFHPNQHQVHWSNDGNDSFITFKGISFGADTAETPPEERDPSDNLQHIFRLNVSGLDIEAALDQGTDLKIGITDLAGGRLQSVLEVKGDAALSEGTLSFHHSSPDGSKVVYYMTDGLWVASLDPEGAAVVHGGSSTSHVWEAAEHGVATPRWSPDGTRIAFAESGGRIRTIKPDGSGAVLVLDRTTSDSYSGPVWSPDSQHLAFQVYRFKRWTDEFYVGRAPAGGGAVTILTSGMDTSRQKSLRGWLANDAAPAP